MPAIIYTLDFQDVNKSGLTITLTTFKKVSDDSTVTPPTVSELSNGVYKFTFNIDSQDSDIYFVADDSAQNVITGRLNRRNSDLLNEDMLRILGLSQENMFIDNQVFDGNNNLTASRVRIYSTSIDVGTTTNVIATYTLTATYASNLLTSFANVKQ